MITALFWVVTQRTVVIAYRSFGATYRSQLQGSRIQKESRLSQYGVYIRKSVAGFKFSGVWCQPVGLMQVAGKEKFCGSQCSCEERRSVREGILHRCGSKKHENIYMSKVGDRKGKKV
jgi:hypothetical protein